MQIRLPFSIAKVSYFYTQIQSQYLPMPPRTAGSDRCLRPPSGACFTGQLVALLLMGCLSLSVPPCLIVDPLCLQTDIKTPSSTFLTARPLPPSLSINSRVFLPPFLASSPCSPKPPYSPSSHSLSMQRPFRSNLHLEFPFLCISVAVSPPLMVSLTIRRPFAPPS